MLAAARVTMETAVLTCCCCQKTCGQKARGVILPPTAHLRRRCQVALNGCFGSSVAISGSVASAAEPDHRDQRSQTAVTAASHLCVYGDVRKWYRCCLLGLGRLGMAPAR